MIQKAFQDTLLSKKKTESHKIIGNVCACICACIISVYKYIKKDQKGTYKKKADK